MAKKDMKNDKKNSSSSADKKNKKEPKTSAISPETKYAVYAVICLTLALFFFLAAFNAAGVAGDFIYSLFTGLFGVGFFLVPILCVLLGISFIQTVRPNIGLTHTASSFLFLFSSLGLLDLTLSDNQGGLVGHAVAWPFIHLFAAYVSFIFLFVIMIASLFVLFDRRPNFRALFNFLKNVFTKKAVVTSKTQTAEEVEMLGAVEVETEDEPEEIAEVAETKPIVEENDAAI